jgi:hypothetical protein
MAIIVHAVPALVATAVRKIKAVFLRFRERMVEREMRRARFEFEMYGGMYRHSSKNDDDLPVVR